MAIICILWAIWALFWNSNYPNYFFLRFHMQNCIMLDTGKSMVSITAFCDLGNQGLSCEQRIVSRLFFLPWVCVCVHVCMCVHVWVCVYVYACVHVCVRMKNSCLQLKKTSVLPATNLLIEHLPVLLEGHLEGVWVGRGVGGRCVCVQDYVVRLPATMAQSYTLKVTAILTMIQQQVKLFTCAWHISHLPVGFCSFECSGTACVVQCWQLTFTYARFYDASLVSVALACW